ncbi:MAG: hypothetical protein WCO94_06140 [Verrucomicrobiota bacterium]
MPTETPSSPGKYVSLYLNAPMHARLQREAEARKTTIGRLITTRLKEEFPSPSGFDLLGGIIGSLEGPADLSTNPAHLEGYGTRKKL